VIVSEKLTRQVHRCT